MTANSDAIARPAASAPPAPVGGRTRIARYAALFLLAVLNAGAVGQFFLAGLNVFDPPSDWTGHIALGSTLGLVAFVVWIPAVLGRVGRWSIVGAVLLPVLFTLQHVFPHMDQAAVRALHPLNGALIFALSLWLAGHMVALLRRPIPAPAA